jgi:hypothetical protein
MGKTFFYQNIVHKSEPDLISLKDSQKHAKIDVKALIITVVFKLSPCELIKLKLSC